MEYIQDLKEFVLKDNKAQKGKTYESVIKKNFPEIYESIKGDWYKENLYCLLYDTTIPKCPVCGEPLHLRNFIKGFNKSCKKCTYVLQSRNNERNENISKLHLSKGIRQKAVNEKYPDLTIECFAEKLENGKRYPRWRVKNYCKHGDIIFRDQKVLDKLYFNHICLCDECKKEWSDKYNPSEEETNKFLDEFNEFRRKRSQAFTDEWFIKYYPREYSIINNYVKEEGLSLIQKVELFAHKWQYVPTCDHKGCTEKVKWDPGSYYRKRCDKHINIVFQSNAEKEIHKYVESLGFDVVPNDRKQISTELDVYVPSKNFAIEFNGVFWHNDNVVKKSSHHFDKWKECKDKGIEMMTIWEDDWRDEHKKEILKSIINSKLGKDTKIFARKCQVVKVDNTKDFLENNHLQGWCQSSYRYGLVYDGELVSLMTFGHNRFKKDEIELLRFCNKKGYSIVGAASRLFKHFVNEYNPEKIISYSNCEISIGNMYEKLGFKEIGHSIDYWWCKDGTRFSRYKFMKSKLVKEYPNMKDMSENQIMKELGYYKVHGVGNLKYEYKIND